MTKYFKIQKNGFTVFNCIHEGKQLMVIPETEEKFGQELSLGDKEFYQELYKNELTKEITEVEFLTAVGNIQGAIQNFIDKTRIG